ncbi:MAG: PorT family protein [Prevotellaceae bacterium]|jgi:hypothetical protein|nr:PorT family protein [Prevotellaceae bacterium]
MKKAIIFFAVALGASTTALAQVKFGAKAGLNVASVSDIKYNRGQLLTFESSGVATGFLAGVYVSYAFSERVDAQAEMAFSQQGGGFKLLLPDGSSVNRKLRQSYVNIPLLAAIKPVKRLPLSILVGPQLGFCVKRTFGEDMGSEPGYKIFDLSAAFGVQYTLIEHLSLGLRYNVGVTPSVKLTDEPNSIKGARNNVLQLTVGWTF